MISLTNTNIVLMFGMFISTVGLAYILAYILNIVAEMRYDDENKKR